MEGVDKALEARVWQRVQGRDVEVDAEEPLALARELAEHYRQLAGKSAGNTERFRRLSGQMQATVRCLRGLCRIRGCPADRGRAALNQEPTDRRVIKCCHLERRLSVALDRMALEPEWGRIYGRLAEDARQRCAALLEILGAGDARG